MNNYLIFLIGLICAAIGGELFVRGTVGIALWARVSPGIIGATIAAFATSSPELSVSVSSALSGTPQIALGDALGSNVVNIALILGLALCISGIRSRRDNVKRDFTLALFVPLLTSIFFIDGVLSRIDGLLLITILIVWLVYILKEVRKQRSAAPEVIGEHKGWLAIVLSVIGLVFLITAGRFIVIGAKGIAIKFGIDEFIIGATIVAVGTSVPELATTIIAKIRKHDEVGLGTILGSNIFNGLLIIGVASVISPITINFKEVAIALLSGLLAVILSFPNRQGVIEKKRGAILLVLYVVYIMAILQRRI